MTSAFHISSKLTALYKNVIKNNIEQYHKIVCLCKATKEHQKHYCTDTGKRLAVKHSSK